MRVNSVIRLRVAVAQLVSGCLARLRLKNIATLQRNTKRAAQPINNIRHLNREHLDFKQIHHPRSQSAHDRDMHRSDCHFRELYRC